jgi:aspartate aminotransferase
VPASPIRSLTPLAAETAARGVHIYHVNIGQPDLPAPAEILQAIRPPADGIIPYAPSHGLKETVEAWCDYYSTVDISFEPRDLTVTTGGGEAIGFAMTAVTDPGDEIIIFDPTYASYLGYAASSNITLVPIPLSPPDYHLPAPEVVERHISDCTRAIVIINPSNPTGTVYTREELEGLMELARRHGLFVISDETYRELVFDDREHVSAMHFPGMEDYVILVDSVSKRFSATGLRVGCVASRNREVSGVMLRLAMTRLSSPTIAQLAVVPLLHSPTTYTSWLREEYQRRRNAAYDAVRAIPGATVARPEGAFYVMVTLPVADTTAFARWLLTDFQRNGETVMVAPGAGFYVTPGLGTREVRLAYVLAEEKMRRAVELLGEAVGSYPVTEEQEAVSTA